MSRVLLILPTSTYRAADFLAAAARLDVDVVTASEQPQALAGVMGDHFLEIDFEDADGTADEIVALNARLPLDAVLAVDDVGVIVAALAAQRLGLRHNPPGAVRATRDKATMRALLADAGVAQPAWRVIEAIPGDPGRESDAVVAGACALGFPVVVKPCSLSGSRGVIRVDDATSMQATAERVRAIVGAAGRPPAEPLLVERFVPGGEVALEGLVSNGVLDVLAIFDKPDPLDGPYFAETIYVTPSGLDSSSQASVARVVASAVGALGIVEGPVHAEVRLSDDGPVILELAARTIGGRCGRSLRFATGASLEELVLAQALRQPVTVRREASASGVMMLAVPSSGRFVGVRGTELAAGIEHVTGVEIAIAPGRHVEALPEGDRYLGFIFARAATSQLVEHALRAALAELEITME